MRRRLIEGVFEALACGEFRLRRRRDLDGLAGARIAAFARLAPRGGECAETDKANVVAFLERRRNGVEHGVHGSRRVRLAHIRQVGNTIDEFILVHLLTLSSNLWKLWRILGLIIARRACARKGKGRSLLPRWRDSRVARQISRRPFGLASGAQPMPALEFVGDAALDHGPPDRLRA